MRGQLATALTQYAELTTQTEGGLGPNHPRVIALAEADQRASKGHRRRTEPDGDSVEADSSKPPRMPKTRSRRNSTPRRPRHTSRATTWSSFTVVQREYEQDRTLYEGLEQRLQTAKVEAGLGATEVDTVDKALPPVSPTLRSTVSIIGTTTALFVLGAIVLAFILESLDTSLHNIQEIEGVMEMPSLAVIPKAKRSSAEQTAAMSATQRNINVLTQPKSQFAEAFRSLRTSLLLATAGKPPKFILFTSATPSEGKTTMACNLACILSQGDAKVLLIDADLRRPNVHHRFGLTGRIGLTTVLAGTSSLHDALQNVAEAPNLDILPSGPVPPFPTEMLSSDAMNSLLEQVGAQYTTSSSTLLQSSPSPTQPSSATSPTPSYSSSATASPARTSCVAHATLWCAPVLP